MFVGEGERLLDGSRALLQHPPQVFVTPEPFGAGPRTDAINRPRVVLGAQLAERDDGSQRLGAALLEDLASPVPARFAEQGRAIDPVTARLDHWPARARCPEAAAELARLQAGVDGDLLQPLVEDAHHASIPTRPDRAPDVFRRRFVVGLGHFHIAVAMHAAARFLVAREEPGGQRL